jgi:hypothetical protein
MKSISFMADTIVILQNEVLAFFFVVKDYVVSMQFFLYEFSLNLNIL